MKPSMVLLLAIIASLPGLVWGADLPSGIVAGVVLDMKNNPVTGASIAIRELARSGQGSRRFVSTDTTGRFSVNNVNAGNYLVIATKDETRMQSPRAFAPPNSAATVVSIGPDLPGARIVVRLGNRTGVISGRIKDAVTGRLVIAKIQITNASSGQTLLSAASPGAFRIPLPSESNLLITVSAAGYQSWTQADPTGFTVHRGERKKMDILLQPTS